MPLELFYSFSTLHIFLATIVFIYLTYEIGYQIGKYVLLRYEHIVDTTQGPMVSGILVTLAFVLAFTFSMAASRFDARKQIVLHESNAIATAYLRADLLASPYKSEVKRLLREYVDLRLQAIDITKREMAITRSLEIHELLWSQITSVAEQYPSPLTALMIQSINQVIDIHEKRVTAALRERIPISIWLTLYAITAFAMMTMGSQSGLLKKRRLMQVVPTVLAYSALITLVADLDRPVELSTIKVSQETMIELQKSINRATQ